MKNFTITQTFDTDPRTVFEAIRDVRAWWSGTIDGPTDEVGAEFRYRYRDRHDSTQRVTESTPEKKIVWRVLDSNLSRLSNPKEWQGSDIVFDLRSLGGGRTELVFTHVGLSAESECYDACSSGWTSLITKNLRGRIATGRSQPDVFAAIA